MGRTRHQEATLPAHGGIADDHPDRRVATCVEELAAGFRPVHEGAVGYRLRDTGAPHVTRCVHGEERHHHQVPAAHHGHPDAAGTRPPTAAPGTDHGAGPSAHLADRHLHGGHLAGRPTLGRTRPHRAIALQQVEQGESHDDGDRTCPCRIAHASRLQMGHHAIGRRQAEGRTTGEHQGVEAVHRAARGEEVKLPCGRCTTTHLAGSHRAIREQHHGATCPGPDIGPVADPHAVNLEPHEQRR